MMQQLLIRPLSPAEYPLLHNFLYEAIFVPPGMRPPSRQVLEQPELKIYTENFGTRKGDQALAAGQRGNIVGVCWCREMQDFGHWQEGIPSLAIAVYKPYRARGIGTALLKAMQQKARAGGYAGLSLSVQKINPAVRLYKRVGFQIVSEKNEDYIMLWRARPQVPRLEKKPTN